MRKIVLILLVVVLITGCSNKREKIINDFKEVENNIQEKDNYKDLNNTPIGIYQLNGNTLTRVHEYKTNFLPEKDINIFQIYPSNEEVIKLNTSFGKSFYNEWIKYDNVKLGFNIKFSLDTGEEINYNIFNPNDTFKEWEFLLNYLYDDYYNDGKNFYSHLEIADFNENTLVTSFKIQSSGYVNRINSNIIFSVFTYDSDDDFKNDNYRGNSIYSITICNDNCQ